MPEFSFQLNDDVQTAKDIRAVPSLKQQWHSITAIARSRSPESVKAFARKVLTGPHEASASFSMPKGQCHLEHTVARDMFGLIKPGRYISLFTSLVDPLSCGNVHISSSNPHTAPRIDLVPTQTPFTRSSWVIICSSLDALSGSSRSSRW